MLAPSSLLSSTNGFQLESPPPPPAAAILFPLRRSLPVRIHGRGSPERSFHAVEMMGMDLQNTFCFPLPATSEEYEAQLSSCAGAPGDRSGPLVGQKSCNVNCPPMPSSPIPFL